MSVYFFLQYCGTMFSTGYCWKDKYSLPSEITTYNHKPVLYLPANAALNTHNTTIGRKQGGKAGSLSAGTANLL